MELRDVSVAFDGKGVLSDISMTLNKGDFLAISGPNGGGKTTLLRIMLKLLRPTSGKVTYYKGGRPTRDLSIGYLPQKSMIDTRFPVTVGEAVSSGLLTGFFGKMPVGSSKMIEQAVALCGVGEYLDKSVGVLSGGQLQRTLLARAIVSHPEVLVLDEPLSYVDKEFEYKIYSIMEELARTTTIVLVSHEMSVISGMANRHIIVNHGIRDCHSHNHSLRGEYEEEKTNAT